MPDCMCPPYYSFFDPIRKYQGCKPDFMPQSCEPGGETLFELTEMDNVDWPRSDAEHFKPLNVTECKDSCLKDCFCSVAIYTDGECWKKKFPLSNGRKANDVNRQAFIKYSKFNSSGRNRKTWILLGSLLLGGLVALNLVQVGAFFLYKRRQSLGRSSSNITGPALCSFTYKELEQATGGFKEEIGRGAFGVVYKGALASECKTLIAVKKLTSLREESEKDFDNEVKTIGQTHHKNLVRLLGFCKEGEQRLLVYEFMTNGSLNKFLFGSGRPDWPQRVNIALDIAGGLAYLHEECRSQIIHCDIKPQNILLDENLVARIADFGLAKLLQLDQTRTSTGVRGTIGYFAPEWFKNVAITAKVDVYSFGVVLLEIICCRKNFDWGLESQEMATVVDWAKECYRNARLDLLVEEDEDAQKDALTLERFVLVAISCIQDEPWLRPSMKKVVQMLEGAIPVSVPPNMYSVHS